MPEHDAAGDTQTKACKECREVLPIGRFRVHQRYRDGRSSRCKQCVRMRDAERKRQRAEQARLLEQPRYHWDGYTARCNACNGGLYCDGDDVLCRACGAQITTARQPVPMVMTRLRLLKSGELTA